MDRKRLPFALLALAAVLAAVACASGDPIDVSGEIDTGGLPARLPSQALFTSNMQPFIVAQTCAAGGCHLAPGQSGYDLSADPSANFAETTCNPRMTSYSSGAAGRSLSYFCSSPTTPVPGGHNARIASALDCAKFFEWAQSGGLGGIPACTIP